VLDRVWRTTLGHRAVGFKINRDQSESVLRQVLGDRDVRKIIVRRSNRIRTYVSERIAEATGEWESYPGLDIGRRPVRVWVEAEDLRQHVGRNRRFYETAGAILEASGQGALDVRNEDLGDGRTHRSILEYLQVAPDVVLQGATRKQNPAALDRLIENFEALRSALRGTELERDLMDQDMSACQAEDVR
jgi:hypothetical protein